MADVLAESMGGGTMFRRQVIQREISRALVLQPLWPKKRCEKHRQDIFVLDTAFALIEAHPARNRMTDWNRFREIQTLRESGRPAEALTEFKALRESATDAADSGAILLHEALSYRDLGSFDKAAEAASEAVRLLPEENPSRPYAEFSLACAHGDEGKFDLAAQELRVFLKRHADLLSDNEYIQLRHDAQRRLIANLIALGHAVEPLSIVNALKTEAISPKERAELLYREAEAHGLLGRHDHALELYQEAITGPLERSLVARAHFHIGEVLYDRSEFSRALDEFKIAETLADPGSSDKDHFAGWVKHTLRAAGVSE